MTVCGITNTEPLCLPIVSAVESLLSDPKNACLECEFENQCLVDVNISQQCDFPDYLEPNEGSPEDVKSHLALMEKGIIVSTGTERSFFDLLFSDEKRCEGLVIRDINPKVKAYVDFNTLLLRISETRDEYLELSSETKGEESFSSRIEVITDKIKKNSLPDKVKCYYQKHLKDFGFIYLKEPKSWRNSKYYRACKYHLKAAEFSKLQAYAKAGNIISTIGDINDLRFLHSRQVAIVDTSNIADYVMLDFLGGENFKPRVITTIVGCEKTDYYSYAHEKLTEEENREFDELLEKRRKDMKSSITISWMPQGSIAMWMQQNLREGHGVCSKDPFNVSSGAIRSRKTLAFMRKYDKFRENMLSLALSAKQTAGSSRETT